MAYSAAPATRGIKEVLDIIGPLLKSLRDSTGETTCFFKAEQHYRVCVAMAETRHALRREMHLGKILPLHAGSAGRVLLAWDSELLDAVMGDPLESITDSTITSSEDLVAAVKKTRTEGFAITVGEREDGASGLSAPVFDSAAALVGAVTISGPTLRMPCETCEAWVEPLLATAENMTRLIGGRFPGRCEAPGRPRLHSACLAGRRRGVAGQRLSGREHLSGVGGNENVGEVPGIGPQIGGH